MRIKNFIAAGIFFALVFSPAGPLAFAANESVDEKNEKIGDGINFGGYLAYVDESYGTNDRSYRFSWSGDNLRVSRGESAVTINAVSGAVVLER